MLGICLLALMVFGVVFVRVSPDIIIRDGERLVAEVRAMGWTGLGLFTLMQIVVAVIGVVPASLLGVAAGTIYGIKTGFLISGAATMIGADLAFLLSRSLFRPAIIRLMSHHAKFRNLDHLIAKDGWKLVCLVRVSPVMPFSATSYMFGLSKIGKRDYLLGTLASLPALFGFVTIGAITNAGLSAWIEGEPHFRWGLLGVGALATILLILRLRQVLIKLGLAPEIDEEDLVLDEESSDEPSIVPLEKANTENLQPVLSKDIQSRPSPHSNK